MKKFLYFFNSNQKKTLLMLLSFMFISTILEMIGLGFIFSIVGALNPSNLESNIFLNKLNDFFKLEANELLLYILLLFLLFYVIKIIFLAFYNWFENNFLYSYQEHLSSKVFKEYLNQSLNYFYTRNSAEFIRNLITEVEHFSGWLLYTLKLILEITIVFGIFCFLAYLNFHFTILITIILLFFSTLYFFLLKKKLSIWGIQRQKDTQKLIQYMQEGFDGIKVIKLLGREDFFFNKFKVHNLNLAKISTMTHFFQGIPRLLVEFLGICFVIFALIYLYYSEKNLIEITQILGVYVAASFRVLPSISRIVFSLQTVKLTYPAMDVLYQELKNFKQENSSPYKKFTFNKNIVANIEKFKYPNSNNFEISNVKLNIQKGQKIGIIGPSASGKSTIIEILTGISKPTKGSITVDDNSIFSNIRGWQNLIGFVPQKIFILDESLRNNILFGLDNKKYPDEKIISMIKKLSLENLLKRLPNGLDGNLGEEGINLSGGEIQRIGLCRALIYNPEILFLDEATSSLDANTESQILDELKLFKEKTIISIAHRINTLKNCDNIYRFDNGKIVDKGDFNKFKLQD